jgi:hypothetical protein
MKTYIMTYYFGRDRDDYSKREIQARDINQAHIVAMMFVPLGYAIKSIKEKVSE